MGIVVRLIVLGLFVLGGLALWAHRTAQAKRRLAEVDAGKRCVGCGGTDVRVNGDEVRCADCLYTTTLSRLRAEKIDASELSRLMRPED
ncbi:hypothetical protein [Sandaracinus amylolyticus]|uniref:hypothetical protein n=1 Tax=Sandaracinus amylolyticus TaxID=927083 RepID=UPI001F2EFDF9|nr:hypothetical protein [Sandaracinus amylolyticus]UJR82856.1 Hypothetical protein I5071_49210 [Sandaracinus amylolyticus]